MKIIGNKYIMDNALYNFLICLEKCILFKKGRGINQTLNFQRKDGKTKG